jgi:hypothetical protein
VENEENEHPVAESSRMMTSMCNKSIQVHKELLKEEFQNEFIEILMKELQENLKENIKNNSNNIKTTQIKNLRKNRNS